MRSRNSIGNSERAETFHPSHEPLASHPRQAKADIDVIYDWLCERSPAGAAAWYGALFDAVQDIVADPDVKAVLAEGLPRWNRDLRQVLFKTVQGKRYRIVYELTVAEIRILRVRGPGQPPLRRRDLPEV